MSEPNLRLPTDIPAAPPGQPAHRPLGRILVERGVITRTQLVLALKRQVRLRARIGEILVSEGWASEDAVLSALAQQFGLSRADLGRHPPDPGLCHLMPYRFWLRHRAIVWQQAGPSLLVATARPDAFEPLRRSLAHLAPHITPVLATEAEIEAAVADVFSGPLAEEASTRVDPDYSCRTWTPTRRLPTVIGAGLLVLGLSVAPASGLAALFAVAFGTLILFCALRLAGSVAHLLGHTYLTAPRPRAAQPPARLPRVSMLVPLYREREIAGALVRRLSRLTYPKALLDVILVLEKKDDVTRETLADTQLPPWMRVVEVPEHGSLTTKPRAMNYALNFCRGEIVGVWDAEDAPAPAQLEQMAAHFAQAPPEVVCLQGILDYYNPRSNWRARCFTIEYASWFRIVLPGIARLRLVVPLGGTTLFFRRAALEALGGWDAHNVTEDAELGVRLARAGLRTEMIDTVTFEEANFRAWPWVRQRSRWLKGFMVTYLVHMRAPLRLWSDLGAWRFLGFQAFFLGTLGQFLLAPLLWSFWPMAFGLPHPLETAVPAPLMPHMFALLIFAEVVNLCVGLAAVSAVERRFLLAYVPTMILYFPLGVVAAYKALAELCFRPFFWDKTQHGQAAEETPQV